MDGLFLVGEGEIGVRGGGREKGERSRLNCCFYYYYYCYWVPTFRPSEFIDRSSSWSTSSSVILLVVADGRTVGVVWGDISFASLCSFGSCCFSSSTILWMLLFSFVLSLLFAFTHWDIVLSVAMTSFIFLSYFVIRSSWLEFRFWISIRLFSILTIVSDINFTPATSSLTTSASWFWFTVSVGCRQACCGSVCLFVSAGKSPACRWNGRDTSPGAVLVIIPASTACPMTSLRSSLYFLTTEQLASREKWLPPHYAHSMLLMSAHACFCPPW